MIVERKNESKKKVSNQKNHIMLLTCFLLKHPSSPATFSSYTHSKILKKTRTSMILEPVDLTECNCTMCNIDTSKVTYQNNTWYRPNPLFSQKFSIWQTIQTISKKQDIVKHNKCFFVQEDTLKYMMKRYSQHCLVKVSLELGTSNNPTTTSTHAEPNSASSNSINFPILTNSQNVETTSATATAITAVLEEQQDEFKTSVNFILDKENFKSNNFKEFEQEIDKIPKQKFVNMKALKLIRADNTNLTNAASSFEKDSFSSYSDEYGRHICQEYFTSVIQLFRVVGLNFFFALNFFLILNSHILFWIIGNFIENSDANALKIKKIVDKKLRIDRSPERMLMVKDKIHLSDKGYKILHKEMGLKDILPCFYQIQVCRGQVNQVAVEKLGIQATEDGIVCNPIMLLKALFIAVKNFIARYNFLRSKGSSCILFMKTW